MEKTKVSSECLVKLIEMLKDFVYCAGGNPDIIDRKDSAFDFVVSISKNGIYFVEGNSSPFSSNGYDFLKNNIVVLTKVMTNSEFFDFVRGAMILEDLLRIFVERNVNIGLVRFYETKAVKQMEVKHVGV